MKMSSLLGSLLGGGLILSGCASGAEPVPSVEQVPQEQTDEAKTAADPLEIDLDSIESVIGSGAFFTTYDSQHSVSHEVVLTDEEDILMIITAMERADRKEGPVTAIGESLTLLFQKEGPLNSIYFFFFDEIRGAFEKTGDLNGRYYLDDGDTAAIKDILYRALEKKTGQPAGIIAFSPQAALSADTPTLLINVENWQPEVFQVETIRIKKLNEQLEWVPYQENEKTISADSFSCPSYEKCEWELELSELSDEWPAGEYRLILDSLIVPFTIASAGE
ncbi:hypothetical protein [Planococcus lenghuensis]|uniref:Uncharacterized protein n=1 Tax=Planococcus lenghuensis TaxID=2213202 RepID=A0A1Q2L0R1_9BACL|nr:hypothetical protein [Planococcus lenghuensis]AQQ54003.1 hypothetical protein B0X71_13465 [Planococcus lenghuensis]